MGQQAVMLAKAVDYCSAGLSVINCYWLVLVVF